MKREEDSMSNHRKAYLEITNKCNLSCAFCPGTARAPRSIDEAEFTLLASKLTGWAEYLYYHLMGEPTAHPLLPRFLEIATELGFKSIITTNGTLLSRRGDELIAKKTYRSIFLCTLLRRMNCRFPLTSTSLPALILRKKHPQKKR